jgi:hypothetical protein
LPCPAIVEEDLVLPLAARTVSGAGVHIKAATAEQYITLQAVKMQAMGVDVVGADLRRLAKAIDDLEKACGR